MGQALGIPDTTNFGNVDALQPGRVYDLCIQHHIADRAGEHFDFRIGNEDIGLLSWAIPKARLPEAKEKLLAVQQPLHEYSYKDFEGEIKEGYGKGTVKLYKQGKVLVTDKNENAIHLTIISDRYPTRLVLIRPKSWNSKDWLILNNTPVDPVKYEKIHMKQIHGYDDLISFLQKRSDVYAAPKIDGAHVIVVINNGLLDVFSYRISKVHGGNILHTERLFTIRPKVELPEKYNGTILKGELYGVYREDGSVVPVNILSGILNSSIYKSYVDMAKRGITLKIGLFDIYQLGKQYIDPESVSYPERLKLIRELLPKLDRNKFHIIEPVAGKDAIINLWQQISAKKHPLTEEGIVIYPNVGLPLKVKAVKEKDVYIREIYSGTGKYERAAGGFTYSLTPDGPIVGHVGTGFDDEFRKELWENKEDFIGRRARVKYLEQLPSGALRAPVFISLHEDYPNPFDKNATFNDPFFLSTISSLYKLRSLLEKKNIKRASYLPFGFDTELAKQIQYYLDENIIDNTNPLLLALLKTAINSNKNRNLLVDYFYSDQRNISNLIKLATDYLECRFRDFVRVNLNEEDNILLSSCLCRHNLAFDADKWCGIIHAAKLDNWTKTMAICLPLTLSAVNATKLVKVAELSEFTDKFLSDPQLGYELGMTAVNSIMGLQDNFFLEKKITAIIEPTKRSKIIYKYLMGL